MTTLMRNGRDRRSGKPVMGHAILERALLVGTRSADHIRASSHSGCIAMGASSPFENRPDTWLHPNASQNVRFPLHRGRRPYMALRNRQQCPDFASALGVERIFVKRPRGRVYEFTPYATISNLWRFTVVRSRPSMRIRRVSLSRRGECKSPSLYRCAMPGVIL